MIVEVRHCASTAVEVVVSEDPDRVGTPTTQFMLLIAMQGGNEFSIALDTGDSIDFEEGTEFDEGEVRRVRHLYKETIEGG